MFLVQIATELGQPSVDVGLGRDLRDLLRLDQHRAERVLGAQVDLTPPELGSVGWDVALHEEPAKLALEPKLVQLRMRRLDVASHDLEAQLVRPKRPLNGRVGRPHLALGDIGQIHHLREQVGLVGALTVPPAERAFGLLLGPTADEEAFAADAERLGELVLVSRPRECDPAERSNRDALPGGPRLR